MVGRAPLAPRWRRTCVTLISRKTKRNYCELHDVGNKTEAEFRFIKTERVGDNITASKTKSVEVTDIDYDTSILCRQLWFI